MKKIPSLFLRPDDDPHGIVINKVNPECQWVLDGKGRPTAKLDGTACAVIDGKLYKRYDNSRRRGEERVQKTTPLPDWIHCEDTSERGKYIYWIPVTSKDYYHQIAWAWAKGVLAEGTYELVGPEVQGNPHEFAHNALIMHGRYSISNEFDPYNFQYCKRCDNPRTYEDIKRYLETSRWEGIVWHHEDGRMAKITKAKFGFPWNNTKSEE